MKTILMILFCLCSLSLSPIALAGRPAWTDGQPHLDKKAGRYYFYGKDVSENDVESATMAVGDAVFQLTYLCKIPLYGFNVDKRYTEKRGKLYFSYVRGYISESDCSIVRRLRPATRRQYIDPTLLELLSVYRKVINERANKK